MIRILPVLLFWVTFIYVILQVPYPKTLTQANFIQISSFLTPLFLAFIFTFNIIIRNFYISFAISLGLIFLLILKALDSLNIVTGILTAVATYLLASYFRKTKRHNLTKLSKIPKLTSLRRNKP
ncbi:MAG: hypothetical protein Q7R77_02655 [Candidatus Daviesbacteria bacterium]|nr:hypothetical protein [Candidatus Daviesbacteria bacterium]